MLAFDGFALVNLIRFQNFGELANCEMQTSLGSFNIGISDRPHPMLAINTFINAYPAIYSPLKT